MVSALLPLLLLAGAPPAGLAGQVLHVDDSAAGGVHDGASWPTAYLTLQDALADPALGPGWEIWVAAGAYLPDQGGAATPGDRAATFLLPDGVRLYGGFDGTEVALAQRAGLFDATVLCGDLAGNDASGTTSDNSRHVVTALAAGPSTVLDGFRITAGCADSTPLGGGGLLLVDSALAVARCTLVGNQAVGLGDDGCGGGAFASGGFGGAGPSWVDCTFAGNFAAHGGGGLYHTTASGAGGVTLRGCRFEGNHASDGFGMNGNGGGAYLRGATAPLVLDCTFVANRASSYGLGGGFSGGNGGGLYLVAADGAAPALVESCVFRDNSSELSGGLFASGGQGGGVAVSSFAGGAARFAGCTFHGNQAFSVASTPGGDGLFGTGALGPGLASCILWENGGTTELAQLNVSASTSPPLLGTCCVQGWTGALPGVGNHGSDPLFADADLRLGPGSPCVDAGWSELATATADLDGFPRCIDDPATPDTGVGPAPVIDMGAYERHPPDPLFADVGSVSLSAGGVQTLILAPGAAHAGELYLVLGSASGIRPGVTVVPGVVLPLHVPDAYFTFTWTHAGSPALTDTLGYLDAAGRATARIRVPAGLAWPPLALHHAFLLIDVPTAWPVFASNAVRLDLVP